MNLRTLGPILTQFFRSAQRSWTRKAQLVAVSAVLVAGLTIPATVSAGAETAWLRGASASAGFTLSDPNDACIQARLFISASETLGKQEPGKPTSGAGMAVFYQRINACTGEFLTSLFGTVPLAAGAFQVDQALRSAALNATEEVCDLFGGSGCIAVDVHLTWTGTGEILRDKEFNFSDNGMCKFHYRSFGTSRTADVSGSLVAEGADFVTGTLFTAQLGSAKEGTTGIGCPF